MNLIDKLTVPFFGKDGDTLVFYHFCNRQKPYPLKTEEQVWALRNVTAVIFVIALMLFTGALTFIAALSLLKYIDPKSIYLFGLNMYWLLLLQPVLFGVALVVYNRVVRGILRG